MGKYFKSGSLVAMAATAILMSSCAKDFELYDPVKDATAKYEKSWKDTFGNIDPNQDWNMATSTTMQNPVYGTDAKTVFVYDAMPGSSTSHLIGEFSAADENFTFDCTKGTTSVYIIAKDAANKIVSANYYAVAETKAASKGMTRASSRAASITEEYVPEDWVSIWDANAYWNETSQSIKYKDIFSLYKLTNVEASNASSWNISDIVDIVGKDGVFGEQGKDKDGNCNKKHWEAELHPSQGAEYIMETDGPMELSYMYGGTGKMNKFGYLYYKNGASNMEILKAPRFILIDDASPQANVKIDNVAMGSGEGMKLPGLVTSYEGDNNADHKLTGTTYKLTYFGEDGKGTPSNTFPAGTHIVFFEIIDGSNKKDNNGNVDGNQFFAAMRYSLPWMNKMFYYKEYENHPTYVEGDAAKNFVTYKWGGQIILGMEDEGGDDDMNDILFFIKGNVKDEEIPEIGEEPESQSWIIACEDLGSTDDYDFNDIVFKVSHVAGQNVATVTPLAAGGIYESHIMFNDVALGETHQMLGVEATEGNYPMINTSSITATGTSQTVTVPTDFSLANSMGGFGITVKTNDNINAVIITAPDAGEAPQMFCVPGTWAWPTERTKIQEAYPNFADWNGNSNNIEWYNNPTAGKVLGGN